MDFSLFNLPNNFRFPTFDWLNKGAFLWGGLGLAAAYAFGIAPMTMTQTWMLVLAVALAAALFISMRLPCATTRPLVLSVLVVLAVVFTLFAAPAQAQQVDLAKLCGNKSMGDPCWVTGQQTVDMSKATMTGHQRVGKTAIYITGKTADGKYNVYNVKGDLNDSGYYVGNTKYSGDDMIKYLDGVAVADIGKGGITCGTICKNAKGQVIGVPAGYKSIVSAKKK